VAASSDKPNVRGANLRTALILLSIALVFFFGIIFAKYVGDASTGMTVIGFAVLLFLIVTIGRNLWSRK
jgi:amino acid transporter